MLTNSQEELIETQTRLVTLSFQTGTSIKENASTFATLGNSVKGTGVSTFELLEMTETLNKAFIVSGTTADSAASALRQLGQGLSAGALRGDEFNSISGVDVCFKYVPKIQQGSGGSNGRKSMKKLSVPMFKEHFDTAQFMREQHQIPADTICYIEEKIHGTSHRIGHMQFSIYDKLPWWRRTLLKVLGTTELTKWIYLNGTRRVVHSPDKKYNSFYVA